MERSYIYDIRTSENAMSTLVNFTGVVPPIWEKNMSKRNQFKYDEELVEYVIDNYGHYPPDYEKWLFVYFHITTSANRCASFEKNGILDLCESYACPDSELRQFLDSRGIIIDIDGRTLTYRGKIYDISYNRIAPRSGSIEHACWSIGRKLYFDFTTCGFLSVWDRGEYGGGVHCRPEILYDIDKLLGLTLSHEWYSSHEAYEVVAAVPGTDIVYDGSDDHSSKDKILNYLTRAYNTAFGSPFEEIVLLKNHVQVPPNRILEINPFTHW